MFRLFVFAVAPDEQAGAEDAGNQLPDEIGGAAETENRQDQVEDERADDAEHDVEPDRMIDLHDPFGDIARNAADDDCDDETPHEPVSRWVERAARPAVTR